MTMSPLRNTRVGFAGPYYGSGKSVRTKEANVPRLQNAEMLNTPDVALIALKGSTSQTFVEQLMQARPGRRLRPGGGHGPERQGAGDDRRAPVLHGVRVPAPGQGAVDAPGSAELRADRHRRARRRSAPAQSGPELRRQPDQQRRSGNAAEAMV